MATFSVALTLRVKNGQVPFIPAFLFPDGVMKMKHEFPAAAEKDPKKPVEPKPQPQPQPPIKHPQPPKRPPGYCPACGRG